VTILRPRSHALEDISRSALEALFGEVAWVARRQTPDYGLDEIVQIFRDGAATEHFFGVQLKATDSPHITAGFSLSIETRHLAHYLALAFPVLLVGYDGSSRTLWFGWAHIATISGGMPSHWRAQTTVTIRLMAPLNAAALEEVAREVQHFYRLPRREDSGAVSFRVTSTLTGEPDSALRAAIVQQVGSRMRRFHVSFAPDGPDGRLHVDASSITAEAGNRRVALPLLGFASDDEWINEALPMVQFISGLLVSVIGRPQRAIDILLDFLSSQHPLPLAAVAAMWLIEIPGMFAYARRTADALAAARQLLSNQEVNAAIAISTAAVLDPSAGDLHRSSHQAFLTEALLALPAGPSRAAVHYSLANSLRRVSRFREAIREYRRAAVEDPSYYARAYWWCELGGCLFLSGRLEVAERAYRQALGCPAADAFVEELLGDVLLRRGSVGEARRILEAYLSKTKRPTPTALLHTWAAALLESRFGATITRDRNKSDTEVTAALRADDAKMRRDHLLKAVAADPFSNVAWFNLGISEVEQSTAAFEGFLMAAIAEGNDLEAWANACLVLLGMNADSGLAVAAIVEAARLHGDAIEECIRVRLSEAGRTIEEVARVVGGIRKLLAGATAAFMVDPPPPVVRAYMPG
jgi:tetratricopeptide (TPR) repeat protein